MEPIGLQSFSILENVIFLKKTPLFSNVTTSELKAIASIAEEITFDAGEQIIKENDVGDCAYIIKEGRVAISKKTSDKRSVGLADLSIGECFGEMSLFDDESRSAAAHACDRCVVLRLQREDLIDVIAEHPYIAIELIKIFVGRLRKANEMIEGAAAAAAAAAAASDGVKQP